MIGDVVKVRSPLKNVLFRSKIIDVESNGDFHVLYIDIGDSEVVQSRDIFELNQMLRSDEVYQKKILISYS